MRRKSVESYIAKYIKRTVKPDSLNFRFYDFYDDKCVAVIDFYNGKNHLGTCYFKMELTGSKWNIFSIIESTTEGTKKYSGSNVSRYPFFGYRSESDMQDESEKYRKYKGR